MGMYATLRRATSADVARLRARPELVESFLYGGPAAEEPDVPTGVLGVLRRLVPFAAKSRADARAPDAGPPAWPPAADGEQVELDKAWHGLHFLFTGTDDGGDEPAAYLLRGGEELGDDDDLLPRLLTPDQVRAFAAYLAALTPDEVRRRFDPERMTALRIYPDVIWRRPEATDAPLGFLVDAFEELRDFMAAAAAAGDAVVVAVA